MYQVLAVLYADFPVIAGLFEKSSSSFDRFINFSFDGSSFNDVHLERNKLLCKLLPENVTKSDGEPNIDIVDTYMCINEMLNILKNHSNVLYSSKQSRKCNICTITEEITKLYVTVQFFGHWRTVLENLQNYIYINEFEATESDCLCSNCSNKCIL